MPTTLIVQILKWWWTCDGSGCGNCISV